METKANYILVGAFTVAGSLGILLFVVWFARLQLDRQFAHYDIYFPNVTGLSLSSDVGFSGLPVGKVIDMKLSDKGDGTVRVRVEVDEGTPIRADSVASLEAQGVTGVSNVSITAGSPGAPLLREAQPGGVPVIRSSLSVLQALSDKGPELIDRLGTISEQLTALLGDENQSRVRNILDNVERSTASLDRALADVSDATGSVASAAEAIAGFGDRLGGLGDAVQTTLATADKALSGVTETATRADDFLAAGTATAAAIGDYVAGDLGKMTRQLDQTAAMIDSTIPGMSVRVGQSLDTIDATLESGQRALASAERAFDGAAGIIDSDVGPAVSDLRNTLAGLDTAVGKVSEDLPDITARLRNAAGSADAAFASLRAAVDGVAGPVKLFAGEGLPQITRATIDLRGLIDNLNQLVAALRRNPSQLISGPKQPEFRR